MYKNQTLANFVSQTSTSSPAPGGGSVAALTAANGASLIAMLCNLTVGKKGYEEVSDQMQKNADLCSAKAQEMLDFIDKDVVAFEGYMSALRLPKFTPEQAEMRSKALEEATVQAIKVPLDLGIECLKLFEVADFAVEHGNVNAISDGAIGTVLLKSAVDAAVYNIKINLSGIKDETMRAKTIDAIAQLEQISTYYQEKILRKVKL